MATATNASTQATYRIQLLAAVHGFADSTSSTHEGLVLSVLRMNPDQLPARQRISPLQNRFSRKESGNHATMTSPFHEKPVLPSQEQDHAYSLPGEVPRCLPAPSVPEVRGNVYHSGISTHSETRTQAHATMHFDQGN